MTPYQIHLHSNSIARRERNIRRLASRLVQLPEEIARTNELMDKAFEWLQKTGKSPEKPKHLKFEEELLKINSRIKTFREAIDYHRGVLCQLDEPVIA